MKLSRRNSDRAATVAVAALLCLSCGIPIARADVVTDWNATAAALPTRGALELAGVMATMHGAIHDALNSIEPVYQAYRFRLEAPRDASKVAAAAAAAHFVLTALVPAHAAGSCSRKDRSPSDPRLEGEGTCPRQARPRSAWWARGFAARPAVGSTRRFA